MQTNEQQANESPSLDELMAQLDEKEESGGKEPEKEVPEDTGNTAPDEDGGAQETEGTVENTDNTDDEPAWLASLPQEARDEYTQARDRLKQYERDLAQERQARGAVEGRLAPVQRALSRREQEIAQLQSRLKQQPDMPTGGSAAPTSPSDLNELFTSDRWKQWASDFPSEAQTMQEALSRTASASEAKFRQLEEKLAAMEPQFGTMNDRLERIASAEEQTRLYTAHPDYQQIDQSGEFWQWFESYRDEQPAEYRRLLQDKEWLAAQFKGADFPISLLNAYKRDVHLAEIAMSAEQPVPARPAEARPAERQSSAAARLAVAPSVKQSAAPRGGRKFDSPGEEFEAIFNALPD